MGKIGGLVLVFAQLLAFAVLGPIFSADARTPADWNVQFDKHVDMNLSAKSVGPQHVESPMNLSGNSVAQRFVLPREDKSGKENEERWDVDLEYLRGFDTINNMEQNLVVQCSHALPVAGPLLVDEVIPPGKQVTWPLSSLDPGTQHPGYECTWFPQDGSDRFVRRVVWAEQNHPASMPFYCVDCLWKVQDDGLYLFWMKLKFWVKIMGWCTSSPTNSSC